MSTSAEIEAVSATTDEAACASTTLATILSCGVELSSQGGPLRSRKLQHPCRLRTAAWERPCIWLVL